MMARNKDLVDQEYTVRNQIKALKDEKMHHKFRLTQFQKQSQVQAAYKKKLFEIASDRQSVLAENYAKGRDAQEKVLAEVSELRKKYDEQIESITTLNNCEIQSNEVCDYIDKYYLAEKQLRETFL